jgi:hypothetical protein
MTPSTCYLCQSPLGADSISAGRTLCHACRACSSCDYLLTTEETKYISTNQLTKVLCASCLVRSETPAASPAPAPATTDELNPTLQVTQETVTIAQATYDRLNLARQICTPNAALSNETNEKEAAILTRRWLHTLSVEEQILHMRRMQACAAEVSLVLKQTKVRLEDVERDRKRRKGTELERSIAVTKKAKNQQIEKDSLAALSPLERKKRRMREQGIVFNMTYAGMDRATAERTFDRQLIIARLMETQHLTRSQAEALADSQQFSDPQPAAQPPSAQKA